VNLSVYLPAAVRRCRETATWRTSAAQPVTNESVSETAPLFVVMTTPPNWGCEESGSEGFIFAALSLYSGQSRSSGSLCIRVALLRLRGAPCQQSNQSRWSRLARPHY